MTNELAATTEDRLLTPLEEAPFTMKTLQTLISTPTVPNRYKQSKTGVADMYAAYLVGQEMGIGPMESINSIFLVNGQVSMLGRLMCAQIYRHGHAVRVEVATKSVTAHAYRRDPYTHKLELHGSWTFSEADAKKAYLDTKGTYENYPKLMWAWRAISALSRIYFADCISGVGHVPEELGLDAPIEPLPGDIELVVDGEPIDLEQASAITEEVMQARVVGEQALNLEEEAARIEEAEVVE